MNKQTSKPQAGSLEEKLNNNNKKKNTRLQPGLAELAGKYANVFFLHSELLSNGTGAHPQTNPGNHFYSRRRPALLGGALPLCSVTQF